MKKITLLLYSLLFITSSLFGSKTDYIIYSSQDYDTVYNTYNTCADTVDPYFPTTYPLFSDSATCFSRFITYSSADWEVLSNSSVFLSTLNHCYDLNRDMLSGNWKIDKSVTETKDLTCEFNCIKKDASCPVVDGVQWIVDKDTCECIRPCVEPPAPDSSVFFNLAGRSCNDSVLTVDEKLYVKRVYPNCSDTECFAEGYKDNDQLCPIPKITVYNNTIMANECVDACPSGEERDSSVFPSECKPINCGTDMYLDTSVIPATCTANPTCNPDQHLDTSVYPPVCVSTPSCDPNFVWNISADKCECPQSGFMLKDGFCLKDTDNDGITDNQDSTPNGSDSDTGNGGSIDDLSGTDVSSAPCLTSSAPNTILPTGYEFSTTSTLNNYDWGDLSECTGVKWRCNYELKLFEKFSYTNMSNYCSVRIDEYNGIYDVVLDSDCQGQSNSVTFHPTSPKFSLSDYLYNGSYDTQSSCVGAISNTVNSVIYRKDINPNCNKVYCSTHSLTSSCNFSSSERMPRGYIYKSDILLESTCASLVDINNYTDHIWDVPSPINCPKVAFCFLELAITSEDTNSENDVNSTMDNDIDLNSTTADLKPLLESGNTSNKHLQDLKDKTDLSNKKLDTLNDTSNNILASNKDINKNLSDLNSKTSSLKSNTDLMNTSLSNLNKAMATNNSNLKGINTNLLVNNGHLSNMAANTRNINDNLINMTDKLTDGLFDDLDPFADTNYSDGSENFTSYQTKFSDNLGVTYQTDLFGLSSIVANSTFQPISVTIHGVTLDIISQSMINSIPVADIRSLFLFMFAIAGFITVFRTV